MYDIKQESPPAWTQGAYRLRRIKYSICFPKWGNPWVPHLGYPPPPSQVQRGVGGTPQPGLMGVPPDQVQWGVGGTPWQASGYTPGQVQWGIPKVGYPLGRGTPGQVWWGVPLQQGVPPSQVWQGVPKVGYPPAGWTWPGYPPCRCGLTNKVKLLPPISYYVRGR